MPFSPLLRELFEKLRCLPGVGPRGAQRMALHLLERDRQGAADLADCLQRAVGAIGNCRLCRCLTEQETCAICLDPRREESLLCIVETPTDMAAVEQAGGYLGRYFVLLGRLSPIDGIGPQELGIDILLKRLHGGVQEVILATSATVEGEATAAFLAEHLQALDITVSRIAHGIPLGGELDFVDGSTLAHALRSRQAVE